MLSMDNADKILRTVYLDAVINQIDTGTSPFFNMVAKGSEDVVGKDVVSAIRFGINGGIGCGKDNADLPVAGNPTFLTLRAPIINIFGNIELSDKILRASQSSAGSFVNVLNSEMESLLSAAKFNFARMLFQDGSGTLGVLTGTQPSNNGSYSSFKVDSVKNFIEGMAIDVIHGTSAVAGSLKVVEVNRADKIVKVFGTVTEKTAGNILTLQGSYKSELYGLPYLFAASSEINGLYGNSRSQVGYILPTSKEVSEVSGDAIQEMLDGMEERSGGSINLIIASYDMRRRYLEDLKTHSINIDYLNLDGGFKSVSYNGIPVYADRFTPENTMYFVNTDDFKLQQLGDWSWIEGGNGKILRQLDNKPGYGATLVKYANLICVRPIGQGKLTYAEPTTTAA